MSSHEPTLNDVLIAIARLEAKQDAMMKQLDDLSKTSDQHWKRINEIETKLAVLEQRQGPRVHWVTWVVAIVAALGFVLAVADRLYITNLTP
jgi:septal ring factor EnvC (AmiA/AmiB activator)